MSVQQVTLGFGKANFPVTYASFTCQRVTAPFVRDSGVSSGRSLGFNTGQEYMVGTIKERGSVYVRPVEHPQGQVLLLQAGWKRNGVSIRDGAIFLRLREGAAKWEIRFKIPLDNGNVIGADFVGFVGHADMLTAEDMGTFGFEVPRSYRQKFMSDEEVEECFTIRRLDDERAPRPNLMVVGTGKEAKVVEVAQQPRRRIIMRSRP